MFLDISFRIFFPETSECWTLAKLSKSTSVDLPSQQLISRVQWTVQNSNISERRENLSCEYRREPVNQSQSKPEHQSPIEELKLRRPSRLWTSRSAEPVASERTCQDSLWISERSSARTGSSCLWTSCPSGYYSDDLPAWKQQKET